MRLGKIDFEKYAQQQAEAEAQLVFTPKNWVDDLALKLSGLDRDTGDTLPWGKTESIVRLRPGELSLWAGYSGHRKSMVLGQIAMHLAKKNVVSIASLEMAPADTLWRMARQSVGQIPDVDELAKFLDWTDERIAIYDQLDKVAWNRIIGFVYYCAKELGSEHIIIDSLTKCGIGAGDGEAEKDFIDRLQWAAKTLGTHIHLVCHVRKPSHGDDEVMPTKYDIRGVSEITDLADNVFICWKDRKKETYRLKRSRGQHLSTHEAEHMVNPDQVLGVVKQRHGEWEGNISLWFHDRSLQFTEGDGLYVPFGFENDPGRKTYLYTTVRKDDSANKPAAG